MRLIVAVIAIVFWAYQSKAQDIHSVLYHDLLSAQDDNPAFRFKGNLHFAIANANVGIYSNGITVDDLIQTNGGINNLKVRNALADIKDENQIGADVSIEPLVLGVAFKDFQFSIGYNARVEAGLTYTDDLAKLVANGNAPYLGQKMNVNTGLLLQTIHEPYLNINYKKHDWSFGVRLKLWNGASDISTNRENIALTTDEEFYQLTVDSDFQINSAGSIDYNGLDSISLDTKFFEGGFGSNTGVGIDLGVAYQASDKLSLSASVLDLGSINWKSNPSNFSSKTTDSFTGFDILDVIDDDEDIVLIDSLEQLLSLEETNNSYKTTMGAKFLLGAKYQYSERMNLVGSYIYRSNHIASMQIVSAIASYRLFNPIQVSFGLSAYDWNNVAFPASLRVGAGMFNFYLATENIFGGKLGASQVSSIRTGIFLTFGAD